MRKISNEELQRPSVEEFAHAARIPVTVILDNVRSANNVGSFVRTCDAFAVERLLLCGITGTPPSRELHKTALGAENTVPWSYYGETAEAVTAMKGNGYRVIAVEQVEGAVMLDEFVPEAGVEYALVFGNEVDGVSQSVADMCDGGIEIPQAGTKHSLNVAVSAGAVLWHMFGHYRRELL